MSAAPLFIPARHFHSGRAADAVDVLVLHTAEGATTAAALGRYFAQTERQASAHSGVDHSGRVDYVRFADTAFAAPGANADGEHLELCGFAKWTRTQWLEEHRPMLDHAAAWLVERCRARRIPPVILDANDLRNNRRGITTHYSVSEAFRRSTHTDPGIRFPLDYLERRVRAGLEVAAVPTMRTAPAFPFPRGHYLGTARASRYCHSGILGGADAVAVLKWQRRMRQRGFPLKLDGLYGERSEAAALQFQRHRRELSDDGLVGAVTWAATWNVPA